LKFRPDRSHPWGDETSLASRARPLGGVWDRIAQMSERLLATMSTSDQRPTDPKSKAPAAE
jgi:hypothetical protein